MTRKLTDDDRRAVDLLLDHGAGDGNLARIAAPVSEARLAAAEKLFHLIGQFPAQEPPTDLVEKTLERIGIGARPSKDLSQLTNAPHA